MLERKVAFLEAKVEIFDRKKIPQGIERNLNRSKVGVGIKKLHDLPRTSLLPDVSERYKKLFIRLLSPVKTVITQLRNII
jgi:hypothetical protein